MHKLLHTVLPILNHLNSNLCELFFDNVNNFLIFKCVVALFSNSNNNLLVFNSVYFLLNNLCGFFNFLI